MRVQLCLFVLVNARCDRVHLEMYNLRVWLMQQTRKLVTMAAIALVVDGAANGEAVRSLMLGSSSRPETDRVRNQSAARRAGQRPD